MSMLLDIAIIFAVGAIATVICHRVHVPSTVGLLLAGVLIGPDVLELMTNVEQIEQISEIGVVLLLFVIGLEFSISRISEIKKQFMVGGSVQMIGTALIIGIATVLMGSTVNQSIYLGFVVALSSTAIVLKALEERAEVDTPHGRLVLGALIFQDIAVVPLMLAAPLLAVGLGEGAGAAVVGLLLRVLAVAALAFVAYRWAVPWILRQVTRTGSREAFLLGVLTVCLAVAMLTEQAGLSLALGAFLAGLIIAESEYSHQAVCVILPFRDVFMSLFFVSLGLLLDVPTLIAQPVRLLLLTLGVLLIKPLAGALAGLAAGLPIRNAMIAGMSLAQIGEFSIVATTAAVTAGLLDRSVFQIVLDTAILTMIVAPVMTAIAPKAGDLVQGLPVPARWRSGAAGVDRGVHEDLAGHIVIVGFGVTGHTMARAAREAGVPYAALEMNAEIVREGRRAGEAVHYGDATYAGILNHVNASKARAIVIAINDPFAARRIVSNARAVAPDAYIIVRSRYVRETELLYTLGADEVIADEVEVSVEVLSRVLARCLVPREEIEELASEVRGEWRQMARSLIPPDIRMQDLRAIFPELQTRTFRVRPDSALVGLTIEESGLRERHGVTVLALRRGEESIAHPTGNMALSAGDALFVIGPVDWDPLDVG